MQKTNLNLIPGGVSPVVNVSQYDEGRQFQLAIFQGTASYDLTGKTVTIEVGKTDGNGCAYDATDTVNGVPVVAFTGNLVTITTPVQMTACAGDNKAELKISDSTAEIGTLNFILLCEQSALSPDTPISETEIPAIIDAAEANAERAEAAVEHYPYINPVNKNWMVWDAETGAFVDTGIRAEGIDGEGSVQSVNNIAPDVNGNVSLPLATGFSDILPTANGGTGNADGYIRTGKKANTLIGTASTIEGQDNEGAGSFGHVEGKGNSIPAGVSYAHVGGVGNTAHVTGASVIGKYAANYGSYNTPLFAVGNGTAANAKSSAFHINTDGSAQVAGNLYKGAAFNTAPSNGFVSASNIADVKEATRTMTALRAKGTHIYVVADDLTYEVTADAGIPANGTLIPDTNAVVWTAAGGYETLSSDLADVETALDGRAALYQTDLETGKAFNCTVSAGVPFVLSVTAAATNQQGLYMGVLRSIGSTGQNILKTIQDNGLTNVGVSIRTNARGILVSNNSGNTVTVSIVGAYVWGVSIA